MSERRQGFHLFRAYIPLDLYEAFQSVCRVKGETMTHRLVVLIGDYLRGIDRAELSRDAKEKLERVIPAPASSEVNIDA